jgi:hypothetical protein
MQIEAKHGRAAWHQIALVPSRQIAAGVPLQQRITVPQGRCDQEKGNGKDGRPEEAGIAQARAQDLRIDRKVPQFPYFA